jgi:hypothetical protein
MDQGHLPVGDVRTLLRLVAELRELGTRPAEWRRHLASSLQKWCGARAVLVGELAVNDPAPSPRRILGRADVRVVHREILGVAAQDEERFGEEVIWHTHGPNEAISGLWPSYGASFTATRRDVVGDAIWYRSELANDRFRALDCDDFMVQVIPVRALRALACVKLYRAWGTRPFSSSAIASFSSSWGRSWRVTGRKRVGHAPPACSRRVCVRCCHCSPLARAKRKPRQRWGSPRIRCTTTQRRSIAYSRCIRAPSCCRCSTSRGPFAPT